MHLLIARAPDGVGRCAVKEGRGQSTISMTPAAATKAIREGAAAALRGLHTTWQQDRTHSSTQGTSHWLHGHPYHQCFEIVFEVIAK